MPVDTPSSQDITPADAEPAPLVERLGGYEILFELSSGGMATVHLARSGEGRSPGPLVAIKRPHRHLSSDRTFLTMLVDEARLASAIAHPNVVKVRELGFESGAPFIVMDYVEGASLAELRRELASRERALDVRVAVRIVLDALAGLRAAHELADESGRPLHVIHRDVSPHNILIGSDGCARLTDFGIAQAEDRVQTTRTHEVKGKLAYLAPERIDKRRLCTVQSDLFSMGVVLWESFAGRRLFQSEEVVDLLQEVMSAPIPSLRAIGAEIPPSLDAAIGRALSRDLGVRYATAAEFADAIVTAVGEENIGAHADVARLVEAVFGPRMAQRQRHVRAAIGAEHLESLLRESGLRARHDESPPDATLEELAPPAPARSPTVSPGHALGARVIDRRFHRRPIPWWTVAAVGLGVVAGAGIALAFVGSRGPAPVSAVSPGASAEPLPLVAVSPARAEPSAATDVDDRVSEDRVEDVDANPRGRSVGRPPPRGQVLRGESIGTMRDGFTKLR